MIKVKDGYAKLIGTTYNGSADRVLLSNGGDRILGNNSNNIPLNNGTVNTNLNADLLDGHHSGVFIFHKKYQELSALPSSTEGWYKIATITDSLGSPCIFAVRTYAHSSVIFTVSKGYDTNGNITVLQSCINGNLDYAHIKAARIISGGIVEILLNKPKSNNSFYVNISISAYNTDNVKLNDTLELDTATTSNIDTKTFINKSIQTSKLEVSGIYALSSSTSTTSSLGTSGQVLKSGGNGGVYWDSLGCYTKSESDDRYVNTTGDTMTGTLTISTSNVGLVVTRTTEYPLVAYHGGTTPTLFGYLGFGGSNTPVFVKSNGTTYGLLHTGNSSVSEGGNDWGSSITVNIGDTSKTLTIPSNPAASSQDWFIAQSLTKTITVAGSSAYWYPVVITCSEDKQRPTFISIWKDLGTTTPSIEGNHSNGTSSLWLQYEMRNTKWDGNGGYVKTWYKSQVYGTLVAHTRVNTTNKGSLIVWLRGGTCTYNISCTNTFSYNIYYSNTNIDSSSSSDYVDKMSSVGNGGIYTSTTYLGYGNIYGNATTATIADKVANVLTLQAGKFSAKTYDGSAAVTVNIPTHTSHLTNDSKFVTGGPYIPTSGTDNLSGSITMPGGDNTTPFIRNLTLTGTSGWARSIMAIQVDGSSKFTIGAYGSYTEGSSANTITYAYLGCNAYNGVNLRIASDSLKWGDIITISDTGNYTSTVSTSTSLYIKLANKDTSIGLRADSGTVRGVYDYGKSKWLVYSDGTDGSVLQGHVSTSSSWSKSVAGAGGGIKILNTVGSSPTGALSSYSIGLEVSGYYSFQLASKAGLLVDNLYFKGASSSGDWNQIAFISDLTWANITDKPTIPTIYERNICINSNNWTVYGPNDTDSTRIYAPTSVGTSGQVLTSNGSGAPSWTNQSNLSVGSAVNAGFANQAGSADYADIAGGCSYGTFGNAATKSYTSTVSSTSDALITSSGVDAAIAKYLPLAGGTMTGAISFNDTSTKRLSPMIKFGSNNQDTILWKVYSSESTYADKGVYGFDMTYKGTGSADGNHLILHADNQNASTKVAAMTITQAGVVSFAKTVSCDISGNAATATTATSANKLGTGNKGSATKPIYLSAGTPMECSTYAGGTSITLNGASKSGSTASFYAPTTLGTNGQVLTSNGTAVYWTTPLSNKYFMPTNAFGGTPMNINIISNAMYAADKRYTVTLTGISGASSNLFNGNYETGCTISAGGTGTITISRSTNYGGYSYGDLYISFYYTNIPQSVTCRVYCDYSSQGVGWKTLTPTIFNASKDASGNIVSNLTYKFNNSYHNISKFEFTITAKSSSSTQITQIDYCLSRGALEQLPVVTKFRDNVLYHKLSFNDELNIYKDSSTGNRMIEDVGSSSCLKIQTSSSDGLLLHSKSTVDYIIQFKGSNIAPHEDSSTIYLGKESYPWGKVYTKEIYIQGHTATKNLTAKVSADSNNNIYLATNDKVMLACISTESTSVSGIVRPSQSLGGKVSLGESAYPWESLYVKNGIKLKGNTNYFSIHAPGGTHSSNETFILPYTGGTLVTENSSAMVKGWATYSFSYTNGSSSTYTMTLKAKGGISIVDSPTYYEYNTYTGILIRITSDCKNTSGAYGTINDSLMVWGQASVATQSLQITKTTVQLSGGTAHYYLVYCKNTSGTALTSGSGTLNFIYF